MTIRAQGTEEKPAPHFWDFESLDELRAVLSEYTAMLDGTLVRRYGQERTDAGVPPPTPEEIAEYERCLRRKRSTIDIAMEQMEPRYRTWHRVIDLYYRQGLSTESRGWIVLMARLGMRTAKCPPLVRCSLDRGEDFEDNRMDLPKCKKATALCCHWDYDAFGVQLTLAAKALLRTIEVRSEWTP